MVGPQKGREDVVESLYRRENAAVKSGRKTFYDDEWQRRGGAAVAPR